MIKLASKLAMESAAYFDEKAGGLAAEHNTLPVYQTIDAPVQRPRKKLRKFIMGFHLVVLTFILSRIVKFGPQPSIPSFFLSADSETLNKDWPIPDDVNVVRCAEWPTGDEDDALSATHPGTLPSILTTFELPISSETLFFLARGRLTHGAIKIVQSEEEGDVAAVDITTFYGHNHILEHAKVCLLDKGENNNGVGIFTPVWAGRHHYPHRRLAFEVVVKLPKSSDGSLFVNNFETDLPMFAHYVADLANTVSFGNISLKTANMPVTVKSLSAVHASVANANSPVEGTYNTSASLSLETANAPIKAVIGLLNDIESDATTVKLYTANAAIHSVLHLTSTKETGGEFDVVASTANAPVELEVQYAPVDSTITIKAATALSPIGLKIHESYEGKFNLASTFRRPSLFVDGDKKDPSGQGRKRDITAEGSGTSTHGTVSWSEEGKSRGNITADTSFAPVTLAL